MALDTLAYAQRLKAAGIDPGHAEAMAEAARDIVVGEFVTRPVFEAGLAATAADLKAEIAKLREEMRSLELRLTIRIGIAAGTVIAAVAAIVKL